MSPTHWLIPHHADTVSAGREEAGDHMKGRGGGRGVRGKRWKMDARGDRIMKTERNSCTEVKPLRACRGPEAEVALPNRPFNQTSHRAQ